MDVFITVGMSDWPFDRLIDGVDALSTEHRVFAQIGRATSEPDCPHARFIGFGELQTRIAEADVVVTHGGNTVRLAQRAGKVPIAVARQAALGEMANDHQVDYLRDEEREGRVIALWDVADLPRAVREHREAEAELLASRPAPLPAGAAQAAETLDGLLFPATGSPFAGHPTRRYHYAWSRLAQRRGRHLDIGCGTGAFLIELDHTSELDCVGVDAHPGYLAELGRAAPNLATRQVPVSGVMPFADGEFSSVSVLDVLEHVGDEQLLLAEIHRILAPGGLLVLTVPARHLFSCLDPDNAKFRFPRFHRAVYSHRFGPETYRERFIDLTDGLRGDIAVERDEHTNYVPEELEQRLADAGLRVIHRDGANLFWRLLHTPALLARGRTRRLLERLIALDGRMFSSANLFLTATREDR